MERKTIFWKHLQPHSEAKLKILRTYLNVWFAAMAKYASYGTNHKTLIYFDGFAGPGKYGDGKDGSPLVAMKTLVNHKCLKMPYAQDVTFIMIFNERNKKLYEQLQSELEPYKDIHERIKIFVFNEDFNESAKDIIEEVEEIQNHQHIPAFFFIDPFGIDIHFDIVKTIAEKRAWEALITFNVGAIKRVVGRKDTQKSLNKLFGEDIRKANPKAIHDEKIFLEYYINKLKQRFLSYCNLYVKWFHLKGSGGKTSLYLLHITHHPKGLNAMKKAMWENANLAGYAFYDRYHEITKLFKKDELIIQYLEKELVEYFKYKRKVSWDELKRKFVEENYIYLLKHLKKSLEHLIDRNVIVIVKGRKTRGGFQKGTLFNLIE